MSLVHASLQSGFDNVRLQDHENLGTFPKHLVASLVGLLADSWLSFHPVVLGFGQTLNPGNHSVLSCCLQEEEAPKKKAAWGEGGRSV